MNTAERLADRKVQLTKRIINCVAEYNGAFNAPCPMKILSARYGKAGMEFGGLPELITELKTSGRIEVWLSRAGTKGVTLPESEIEVENAVKL